MILNNRFFRKIQMRIICMEMVCLEMVVALDRLDLRGGHHSLWDLHQVDSADSVVLVATGSLATTMAMDMAMALGFLHNAEEYFDTEI